MPFRRLPSLKALRAFEAAARRSSFKDAAEELAVTPAAISQQIRSLEEDLAIPLFERAARSVTLTEQGAQLGHGLAEAFVLIQSSVDVVRTRNAPELSISCSGPIATKCLAPRLHRFSQRHPDISVQIDADVELMEMGAGGPDITLRFGRKPSNKFYFQLLNDEILLPLASPELVDRLSLSSAEDMLRAPLLHDVSLINTYEDLPNWTDWFAMAGLDPKDAERGLRFNTSGDQAIDAAVGGAGVLLGRIGLAVHDMEAGRLVCPFGPLMPVDLNYYAVCAKGREKQECIAAFLKWIKDESVLSTKARVFPAALAG